jgi:hypothetical protein
MAAQKAKTGNYQNQRLNHIRQTAHLYILSSNEITPASPGASFLCH